MTSATWKKEGDKIYWVEERTEGVKHIILSKKEPLDAGLGLTKSHFCHIITMAEEKLSRYKTKTTFWVYESHILIKNEDEKRHMYLKINEKGKVFLWDIWNLQCCPCSISRSTPDVIVTLSEPKEITKTEAIELLKNRHTLMFNDYDEQNQEFGKYAQLED